MSILYKEEATILLFAARHGRTWKNDLRLCWMKADYPGDADLTMSLQSLRNAASFGTKGLEAYRLPRRPVM